MIRNLPSSPTLAILSLSLALCVSGCNDDTTKPETPVPTTTPNVTVTPTETNAKPPTTVSTPAPTTSTARGTTVGNSDTDFVHEANMAGLAEIKTSELVVKRGATGDVLTFAQQMIKDHTAANDKLAEVVKSKGIPLATVPDAKTQAEIDKLSAYPDNEIMAKYIDWQTTAHKEAVELFTKEATSGTDADIKAFAEQTKPTLEEHLKHVESLSK